jgi:SAM-dependent methyltransferase
MTEGYFTITREGHVIVHPPTDERPITEGMLFMTDVSEIEHTIASKMRSDAYHEGYWERGEGSNYVAYGDDPGWPVTAAVLASELPLGASLLEVASAKGYFLLHARGQGLEAWGIDLSEYAVANCHPAVAPYLRQGNVVDLPYADAQFSVVCSWEFLEHVYEDEIDRALDEMQRVCWPGGLQVHRIGLDMGVPEEDYAHQQHDVTHVLEMPREWWTEKFEARGWTRVKSIEDRLDEAFTGRDWQQRFFAWTMPTE